MSTWWCLGSNVVLEKEGYDLYQKVAKCDVKATSNISSEVSNTKSELEGESVLGSGSGRSAAKLGFG